jgi:hypothetical protein
MSCEAVGVLLLDHNEAMLMLLLSSRETVLSKAKQTGGGGGFLGRWTAGDDAAAPVSGLTNEPVNHRIRLLAFGS